MKKVFQRNATIFIHIILIQVNEFRHGIHGLARTRHQGLLTQEMPDEHGGEDVARAGEMDGDLGVFQ